MPDTIFWMKLRRFTSPHPLVFSKNRSMTSKSPRVAILVESSSFYGRGLLRGILSYVRKRGSWSIYIAEQSPADVPEWLRNWKGDGVIARVETPQIYDAVMKTGARVIDLSATRSQRDIPYVGTDDQAAARLAAKHLLGRGFKHFGYCGDERFNWSYWRSGPFVQSVADAGYRCSTFQGGLPHNSNAASTWEEEKELTSWLKELPKPAGIMACNDFRGWQLLEICRRIGIAVPDELAIIGVDNDELLCDLSTPPLTSVELDTFRSGYEGAKILDQWMSRARPPKLLRVKPLRVVTRQSTDVLTVPDSDISSAIRFIREHACEGIKVDDILKSVPLSRRVLEHRFKKLLGRTPHDEILRVQFQQVIKLLTETDLSLFEVAERSGFRYAEYLSTAFKRRFGMPPKKYREQHAHPS
jgi:LacI family transcriptional regulator